jgi:excisionase family DNA binding protein
MTSFDTSASTEASTPQPRVLLSAEAAAEQLSISRTRMYQMLKSGEIASVKVGRLRRIPAEALTNYLQRLTSEQYGGVAGGHKEGSQA